MTNFGTDIATIGTDSTTAGNTGAYSDDLTVQSDCQTLTDDAVLALGLPPIPLANLEKVWSLEIRDFQGAGPLCVSAVIDQSTQDLGLATALMGAGKRQSDKLLGMIASLATAR